MFVPVFVSSSKIFKISAFLSSPFNCETKLQIPRNFSWWNFINYGHYIEMPRKRSYLWKLLLCHWNISFPIFWDKMRPIRDLNDQFLKVSLVLLVTDFWNPSCLTPHHLMPIQQFLYQYDGYWIVLHPKYPWNMFHQLDRISQAKPMGQQMDRIHYRTRISLRIKNCPRIDGRSPFLITLLIQRARTRPITFGEFSFRASK